MRPSDSPRGDKFLCFSVRDWLITAGILLAAVGFCVLLRKADSNDGAAVSLVFVLAVLLISRLTSGYFYGLLASLAGVIGVNYIFTYPYLAFNFTIAGYPITFLTLLVVSAITSALTTQIKRQERLRLEGEKEKMRANLLRSVSHDIRTPLTSIVGATSAVLENQDSLTEEQKRRLLTDVKEDAQWLIRVVENLLSITRMGSDTAQITKADEVAEEVLAETVRKFRKRFPQMPVHVKAPDELLVVPMDPILIEQVLGNLLENAVLHATGATEIQLSARQEENWAVFSVQDDGCGIPDELLPKLFDGTLRHNETTSGDGKRNMNIGLAVCTAIVRAHGGALSAANRPQGGAEFTFRLPLYQVKES